LVGWLVGWPNSPLQSAVRALKNAPFEIKFFLHRVGVLGNKGITGRDIDFYPYIFASGILAFFWIILFENYFTGQPSSSWKLFLVQSSIPSNLFFLLLGQFLIIVLDRIIYLFKSIRYVACAVLEQWSMRCADCCGATTNLQLQDGSAVRELDLHARVSVLHTTGRQRKAVPAQLDVDRVLSLQVLLLGFLGIATSARLSDHYQ
jgi:hypothetical protein